MVMRSADAVADGMSEEVVCQLSRPEEAPDLSARERAALEYADRIATAHHDMDDELFHRLEEHFTEAEIIELGLHVAFCIGFGRVAMSWDLVDELPEGLRQEGTVAPWDADGDTHVR
jgi:alkylhydroperoxidase family enzyme